MHMNDAFGLGMTSSANANVIIRSVHFLTCCGSFSFLLLPEPGICIIVHIVISSIILSQSYNATLFLFENISFQAYVLN